MSQRNIEVLGEFIELYKSEPCLWKVKADEYHDRDKRNAAYRILAMKLKEIEPDADETLVKKKINSLRSNVRKEQRKIESSMKSGASADNVYKPSLWYFKLFDFLKDQDNTRSSVSNLSSENDNDEVIVGDPCAEENDLTPNVSQEDRREPNRPTPSTRISRPGPGNKRKSNDDISDDILSTVRDHFKQPQPQIDCCELLGKTVTMKMRGIKDRRLHIMFEKKINDLLFEAEMCTLNYPNFTVDSEEENDNASEPSTSRDNLVKTTQRSKKRKHNIEAKRNELLELACSYPSQSDDAIDNLAKSWGEDLKKLDGEQQIYAKKVINDILFEGSLGSLPRHSVKMNEENAHQLSS
ncbi:uncharacterized protein [Palaemon carinicauda]|uniref:uncharacterized protein isoform X1 n=1 Tax=Palaemon carinicauda TaxID=392227 RepID=UPI0035B5F4E8